MIRAYLLAPALLAVGFLAGHFLAPSSDDGLRAGSSALAGEAEGSTELGAEVQALRAENEDLLRQMARMQDQRIARESRWLEYTNAVSDLPIPDVPDRPGFFPEFEPEAAPAPEPEDPRVARGRQILNDLRAFLTVEHVDALDLLEVGLPHEGWTGPVVVRLVDRAGRPSGVLAADRLHLECSRAGHLVTLVFQDGYELRDGRKVPFGPTDGPHDERGGVRRVALTGVDPGPWLATLPELFDPLEVDVVEDDGRWDLGAVRANLNFLMAGDTTTGHWRVAELGGVVRGVLTDVQLVELDDRGKVERRLFADDVTLQQHGTGVALLCTDGVTMRGSARTPFLEGRYTLYLPTADVEEWRSAGLPGFAPPVVLGRELGEEPAAAEGAPPATLRGAGG